MSQNCDGAGRYALKRSLAEKLLTTGRNPIEQRRLHDLAFVHYNLQLQQFLSGMNPGIIPPEIDPMDDWVVNEAVGTASRSVQFSRKKSRRAERTLDGAGPSNTEAKKEPF